MTLWNLGSINADIVYRVPHIPAPGETLASTSRQTFLGGKGTNMSVAAARAGAHVRHIGAVGPDGRWARDRLMEYGVDTRHIAEIDTETAQAIIAVDDHGENAIILHPGANHAIPESLVQSALTEAAAGDRIVLQNETNLQFETARLARDMGLWVAYAAAPFSADRVEALLPYLDFLILNAVEAQQLEQATGLTPAQIPVGHVMVTRGAEGATYYGGSEPVHVPAPKVRAVDTTGAGDTFTGYVLAGLDRGLPMEQSLNQATLAAALMVMRAGTADVIPDLAEVQQAMQGGI